VLLLLLALLHVRLRRGRRAGEAPGRAGAVAGRRAIAGLRLPAARGLGELAVRPVRALLLLRGGAAVGLLLLGVLLLLLVVLGRRRRRVSRIRAERRGGSAATGGAAAP
jgi:hypothetical protein